MLGLRPHSSGGSGATSDSLESGLFLLSTFNIFSLLVGVGDFLREKSVSSSSVRYKSASSWGWLDVEVLGIGSVVLVAWEGEGRVAGRSLRGLSEGVAGGERTLDRDSRSGLLRLRGVPVSGPSGSFV